MALGEPNHCIISSLHSPPPNHSFNCEPPLSFIVNPLIPGPLGGRGAPPPYYCDPRIRWNIFLRVWLQVARPPEKALKILQSLLKQRREHGSFVDVAVAPAPGGGGGGGPLLVWNTVDHRGAGSLPLLFLSSFGLSTSLPLLSLLRFGDGPRCLRLCCGRCFFGLGRRILAVPVCPKPVSDGFPLRRRRGWGPPSLSQAGFRLM